MKPEVHVTAVEAFFRRLEEMEDGEKNPERENDRGHAGSAAQQNAEEEATEKQFFDQGNEHAGDEQLSQRSTSATNCRSE